MVRTLCFICTLIALSWSNGCDSKSSGPTYESADQFILYSIDGMAAFEDGWFTDAKAFRGVPVLGQTSIEDPKKRAELMTALHAGIDASDGLSADCDMPRHGIRVVEGEQTIDYVICFECSLVRIYHGDEQGIEPRRIRRAGSSIST